MGVFSGTRLSYESVVREIVRAREGQRGSDSTSERGIDNLQYRKEKDYSEVDLGQIKC